MKTDPNVVRRPATLANDDPRRFTIKSGPARAIVRKDANGNDRYVIEGTASSSVRDRHGDTLTDAAQLGMLDQTKSLTMWLNHSYDIPEDILGTCSDSDLESEVDPTFGPCIDLKIACGIYPGNVRAKQAWDAVNSGVRLAFSIGGYFLDAEFDESSADEYWWPMIVNAVELLEISLVGIPANPRAYTKGLDSGFLPYMVGQFRERVKSVGDAPRQLAFAKSLFSSRGARIGDKTVKTCAHKDGCENPKAPNSLLCEAHAAAAPLLEIVCMHDGCAAPVARFERRCAAHKDATEETTGPVEGELSTEHQLRAVAAMKSMKLAYGHGMCTDAAANIKDAHAQVKAMLPDDYGFGEDDPSDLDDGTTLAAPAGHTCSAGSEMVKITLEADLSSITEQIAAAKAEVETLSSTATQRAAEVTEAEKRVAALKAEETALQAKIDQLAATPIGRLTATPGGSSHGAYKPKTETIHEARSALAKKLSGYSVDDPAQRPA